ncbi:hypothetical protein FRB94_007213 [Tulasnella sp. JGI-2019a]|nr:hypothetical protein FRB94_007213 [Tulasnella sp. JGI-2019a]
MHASASTTARTSSLLCSVHSHLRSQCRATARLKSSDKSARLAAPRHFSQSSSSHQSHLIAATPRSRSFAPSSRLSISAIPHPAFYHASDQPRKEFIPPCSNEEATQHLRSLLPSLEFPEKVVLRMITHPSWKAGFEGHNNRLSFMGRRVLNAYLILFLHDARARAQASSSSTETPEEADYQAIVESVLDTGPLGKHVGGAWKVEEITRWISNVTVEADKGLHWAGRHAARAATVEAIMGGVLHQYGATVAHRVFHTRILPHLSSLLHPSVRGRIDEVCNTLGGPDGALLDSATPASKSTSPVPPTSYPVEDEEPPLRRASASY